MEMTKILAEGCMYLVCTEAEMEMIKSFIMFDCLLRVIGKAMNTPVCESQES